MEKHQHARGKPSRAGNLQSPAALFLLRSLALAFRACGAVPHVALPGFHSVHTIAVNFHWEPPPKWLDMDPRLNDVHQRVPEKWQPSHSWGPNQGTGRAC